MSLFKLLLFWLIAFSSQAESNLVTMPSLPDNLTIDESLSIESTDLTPTSKIPDPFWAHFTFKISQQVYAQVNDHMLASGRHKPAAIEDNRLNILVKYQNAFAPGWNIQGSAQSKLYWPSDYDYRYGKSSQSIELEQRLENTESRLNELYISKSFSEHTLKLGRQTIVWGENEGNSILDNLNTLEFRDLSIIEMEDARLNQWFGQWDYFNAQYRISSFINLNPQFNPLPRIGSPAYIPIAFPVNDPHQNDYKVEVGSRLQWSIAQSDFALMSAYLYENQLHYHTPATLNDAIQAQENGYWLFGASANRAIGKLLLKFDFAYSQGLLADTLRAPQAQFPLVGSGAIRKNQIGATVGFDYSIDNQQTLNISVLARGFLDRTADLKPGEATVNGDIFGTWLFRYSHSFLNNTLLFSTYNRGSLNADQVLTSAMLNYAINDHWSVMGIVIGTFARANSAAALLDQDVRVGFTLSYSQ